GAAALVLLAARLAVLVGPDRDVLGAVVGGEARPAQGEGRRGEREPTREQLLRQGPEPGDPRRARTAIPLTSIEPSTTGRSNARRASGSARRIRGSRSIASRSRAGPRRSGLVTSAPRTTFLPDATLSSPSGVRTATAQAVGPWTSTPFWSAIPPRRSFSSLMARA